MRPLFKHEKIIAFQQATGDFALFIDQVIEEVETYLMELRALRANLTAVHGAPPPEIEQIANRFAPDGGQHE